MIRAAEPKDLPAIERIIAQSFALYVPRMDRVPGPMLDDYGAHVAAGRARVYDTDGAVLGVLVLTIDEDGALLDVVAVAPEAQGKGVGTALIAAAEAMTRKAGKPEIRLYTNEVMTENLPLYRKLGFVETGRAEQAGYRRVFMTKALL